MNKIKTCLIVAILAIGFSACSSDDDTSSTPETPNFTDLIIGTWQLTSITENGEVVVLDDCETMSTLQFLEDSMLSISDFKSTGETDCIAEVSMGTYSISGDMLTTSQAGFSETSELIMLTETTLSIGEEETFEGETLVIVTTFIRQ